MPRRFPFLPFFVVMLLAVPAARAQVEVAIPDTSIAVGAEVLVPVRTDDVTPYNVLAFSFTVTFDPAVIEVMGVTTAGTISEGRSGTTNLRTAGQVRFSYATTSRLQDGGVLVYLRVRGKTQGATTLHFDRFQYNELNQPPMTEPGVQTRDGRVTVGDAASVEVGIQWIHASPDPSLATVDLYAGGQLVADDLGYLEATGTATVTLPAGTAMLAVAPATSNSADAAIAVAEVALTADARYRVLLSGVREPSDFPPNPFGAQTGLHLTVAPGFDGTLAEGETALSVGHAVPNAPPVGVRLVEARPPFDAATTLTASVPYRSLTAYTAVSAAPYVAEILGPDGSTALSLAADLTALGGTSATLVAAGFLGVPGPTPPPVVVVAVGADGTVIPFAAVRLDPINVVLPEVRGTPGEDRLLPVSAPDLTGQLVRQFDLEVRYDHTVLDITGASLAGTLAEGGQVDFATAGDGVVTLSFTADEALAGAGTLLYLEAALKTVGRTTLEGTASFNGPLLDATVEAGAVAVIDTAYVQWVYAALPVAAVELYVDTLLAASGFGLATPFLPVPVDAAEDTVGLGAAVGGGAVVRVGEPVLRVGIEQHVIVTAADGTAEPIVVPAAAAPAAADSVTIRVVGAGQGAPLDVTLTNRTQAHVVLYALATGFGEGDVTVPLTVEARRYNLRLDRGTGAEEFFAFDLSARGGTSVLLVLAEPETDDTMVRPILVGRAGAEAVLRVNTADEPETALPDEVVLHGNYPNPFNPATTVVFDLPWAAEVSVEVMDVTGRQVLALAPRAFAAGTDRRLTLEAASLASGMYLYRLRAKGAGLDVVRSGRMVVLK